MGLPAGIYPYLVSPIDARGDVAGLVMGRLIEDLIEAGIHGLCPLGSTGEVMYLTFAQRRRIVEETVRFARGQVPVVPGVAAFGLHDAVEQATAFEQAGASGLVLMRQSGFPASEEGVIDYFAAVADAVRVPIVLYTNPSLLGAELSIDVIVRLSAIPNVKYIKDASGNTGRILSIINHIGEDLGVFSASAHIPLFVFELGGMGWMAGPACVAPRAAVMLFDLFQQGDRNGALELQRELWYLNEAFERYSPARSIKAALHLRGYDVGDPISPQAPLEGTALQEIESALRRADAALAVKGAA